ncbi:MAG: site-specific DNA-methyltransferase [Patescibacteria group bacterium]
MKKIDGKTSDLIAENIEKLKQLFPEIWEEGKVDLEMLKKLLGEKVETDRERYCFSWHGKSDAIKMALKQSTGTLRPKKADSKDWDKTNNLYIEGDNLEVLRVLQDSYRGKVKMIYIDPPYNTGKDFVYEDNFADNIQNYKEKVGDTMKANADSSGRKHTNWLNMMYPRLRLARNLLKDDGVIFISIDDNEQANLKKVCDEIFGEENFIENYIWESTFRPDNSSSIERKNAQYVTSFAKDKNLINQLIGGPKKTEGLPSLTKNSMKEGILNFPSNTVKILFNDGIYLAGKKDSGYELLDNVEVVSGVNLNSFRLKGRMIWSQDYLENELNNGTEIIFKGENFVPYSKKLEVGILAPTKIIPKDYVQDVLAGRAELKSILGQSIFDYPKPLSLINYLLSFLECEEECIVLDFFSGSATTAHSVMQLNAEDGGNRKFVMVQLPEVTQEDSEARKAGYKNICEIGKERIRRAGEKIVKELKEKQDKKQEKLIEGGEKVVNPDDLDVGFKVFELDETNFTKWDPNTQDVEKSMMDQLTPIKADRADEDAVYEIMLKYGVDLTMPIEELKLAGKKVFSLAGNYLLLCLEKQIGLETVGEMAKLSPHRVVFFDDGFADDTVKANAEQTLKKAGVEEILVI